MSEAARAPEPAPVGTKQNIPIQLTDLTLFDDTYAFMKERFVQEMKRVDSHMNRLNKALTKLYHQTLTVQTGLTSQSTDSGNDWDHVTNSPLVETDGDDKMLKLQFDLSQFDPEEVTVLVADDLLTVSATHAEKTDKYKIFREYNREFQLPKGTNPDKIISAMSRDGILTVKAPLLNPIELTEDNAEVANVDN